MDGEKGSTLTPFDPRDPTSVQVKLQILNAEHQSLLAARSLAWNESFARAGMYLSILSASIVALGLIAGIDKLGDVFVTFAVVILPVVLFVGIVTVTRMGIANYHEGLTVWGMNRIRAAYLELAPDLEPYFVMGTHDDYAGMQVTMAIPQSLPTVLNVISATPFLVTILNGVVSGAIMALVLLHWVDVGVPLTVVVSGATFIVAVIAQGWVATWSMRRAQGSIRPLFPTPDGSGSRRAADEGPVSPSVGEVGGD
jgi:hypothetical protein